MDDRQRIESALEIAVKYGGIDGEHHKTWVIDQMVRALTGCPFVTRSYHDAAGLQHFHQVWGESDEYHQLVAEACAGEDGPETYSWDVGTGP